MATLAQGNLYWGRGLRIATTSVRTGLAMTRCKECRGRADVGSESSAAGGRYSEVSEWPRSKFQASAVRQRGNFGHRNRTIVPYGVRGRECLRGSRADRGVRPYGWFARSLWGGRPRGSPLRTVTRSACKTGRRDTWGPPYKRKYFIYSCARQIKNTDHFRRNKT